jgi:hypothetical protein
MVILAITLEESYGNERGRGQRGEVKRGRGQRGKVKRGEIQYGWTRA